MVDKKNCVNNPHSTNEDPEEHLGKEIPDPWDDETQKDWPTGRIDIPEEEV